MLAGASVDREIKMSEHGYQGIHREHDVVSFVGVDD